MPFSIILEYIPYTPFFRHRQTRNNLNKFWAKLFLHMQQQEADGTLMKGSIAEALVKFSKIPGITSKDVESEISILFIAGHETTAHSLSWYMYSLCKHPDIQELNRTAIMEMKDPQGSDSLVLPPIVEATLKESMRKYAVVVSGSTRRVDNEAGFTLKGAGVNGCDIHLPRGTWIQVPIYALHNCTSNWGFDAGEFNPYRWFDSDDESKEEIEHEPAMKASKGSFVGWGPRSSDLSFAPFSFGPRNCLGTNLALLELRKAIPRLLSEFSFKLADPAMADESIAMETFLTLHPANELRVNISSHT